MAWYIDSTRIFVNDWKESEAQIIPRLQPLAGGTVLQIFGYENPITRITGLVVGVNDKDAVKAMGIDGALHTLSGPYGLVDDFYVKSVAATMQPTLMQTIRPDLDCYDPVYVVEMELYV